MLCYQSLIILNACPRASRLPPLSLSFALFLFPTCFYRLPLGNVKSKEKSCFCSKMSVLAALSQYAITLCVYMCVCVYMSPCQNLFISTCLIKVNMPHIAFKNAATAQYFSMFVFFYLSVTVNFMTPTVNAVLS